MSLAARTTFGCSTARACWCSATSNRYRQRCPSWFEPKSDTHYHFLSQSVILDRHKQGQNGRHADAVPSLVRLHQISKNWGIRLQQSINLGFIDNVVMHEGFEDREVIDLFPFASLLQTLNQNSRQVLQPVRNRLSHWHQHLMEQRQPLDSFCSWRTVC